LTLGREARRVDFSKRGQKREARKVGFSERGQKRDARRVDFKESKREVAYKPETGDPHASFNSHFSHHLLTYLLTLCSPLPMLHIRYCLGNGTGGLYILSPPLYLSFDGGGRVILSSEDKMWTSNHISVHS